ncbi:MAG: hypothetical protein GY811_05065 [Myxococcales bacterium]|nr:hypothetical protein [Myxococcales bacterium]
MVAEVVGTSALLHNSLEEEAGITQVFAAGHNPATVVLNLPRGTVEILRRDVGVTLEFDFVNETSLDGSYILDGATVPPGWQATISVFKEGSSGPFFLSLFGEGSNLPSRHLGGDQQTLTVVQDNCTREPMPLELIATPYGHHNADSTRSNLTIRYQVTLELVSDCESLN